MKDAPLKQGRHPAGRRDRVLSGSHFEEERQFNAQGKLLEANVFAVADGPGPSRELTQRNLSPCLPHFPCVFLSSLHLVSPTHYFHVLFFTLFLSLSSSRSNS